MIQLSRGALLTFLLFLFPYFSFAQKKEPEISIFFQKEIPSNKEVEIKVSILNLKNGEYDLKIGIEKEKILSETFNEREGKWQSSNYYLKNYFSGNSFEGNFKLRLKKENLDFKGEADLFLRIRESGKSSYFQKKEKITFLEPEITSAPSLFETEKINEKNLQIKKFLSPFVFGLLASFIFGLLGLKFKRIFKIKF